MKLQHKRDCRRRARWDATAESEAMLASDNRSGAPTACLSPSSSKRHTLSRVVLAARPPLSVTLLTTRRGLGLGLSERCRGLLPRHRGLDHSDSDNVIAPLPRAPSPEIGARGDGEGLMSP